MAPKKIAQTVLTEGKFYTISAANGKVVEVADYNIDNGAKIQLMDNANFEWQQWNFVAAGDGVYRIQNRFTGKMMDLDMGGVSDGTRVHPVGGCPGIQPAVGRGAYQRWPRQDQVQPGRQAAGPRHGYRERHRAADLG